MALPDEFPIISIETERTLRQAARKYIAKLDVPEYLDDSQFTEVYQGPISGLPDKTIISGGRPELITVSSQTTDFLTALYVHIDLSPDSPAAIVQPRFANHEDGTLAPRRPFVRFLTEFEGQALSDDLLQRIRLSE